MSSQASQSSSTPGTPSRQISSPEDEIVMYGGQSSSIANLVAKAASLCNRIVVEKCAMCTVYCDEQIRQELLAAKASPTIWMPSSLMDTMDDIQTTRRYLFDEESVVDSISDRC